MSKCSCFLVCSSERYCHFKQSPENWPLWVLTLFCSRDNFVYKLSSLRISDVPGTERMHYNSTVNEVQVSISPFSYSKYLDYSKPHHSWSHRLHKAIFVFSCVLIKSLTDVHRKSLFCLVFFFLFPSLFTLTGPCLPKNESYSAVALIKEIGHTSCPALCLFKLISKLLRCYWLAMESRIRASFSWENAALPCSKLYEK